MSLDVDLMVTQPTSVYSANITHNLGKMASEVKLDGGLTLYDVLWRPDEHGMVFAKDISDHLEIGWNILLSDPEKFMKFEPEIIGVRMRVFVILYIIIAMLVGIILMQN
jgi:hypothetical protein